MSDIFHRTSVIAIDDLIDFLSLDRKSRTFLYQYLANKLRGAWEKETIGNPAIREFADQLVEIRIRHKDAIPPQYRNLPGLTIIEDDTIPVTECRLVFFRRMEKDEKL